MHNNLQTQITQQLTEYIKVRYKRNALQLSFLFTSNLNEVDIYLP